MIQVTTFVLKLATAFLCANSSMNNGGSRYLRSDASLQFPDLGFGSNQLTTIGSVKLTGSDNGVCQALGLKNGCDSNLVLQATLYDDGSVVGKLTDVVNVGNGTILVQADADCMKFFSIGGDKYVVVGGVFTKGYKIDDIFELDTPLVGSRYLGVAKEDADGDVFYSGEFITSRTCDDITGSNGQSITTYKENIDGQATIVFPSDPVNCGDTDSKKECRKSKDCEWNYPEGTCVLKDVGLDASPDLLLFFNENERGALLAFCWWWSIFFFIDSVKLYLF